MFQRRHRHTNNSSTSTNSGPILNTNTNNETVEHLHSSPSAQHFHPRQRIHNDGAGSKKLVYCFTVLFLIGMSLPFVYDYSTSTSSSPLPLNHHLRQRNTPQIHEPTKVDSSSTTKEVVVSGPEKTTRQLEDATINTATVVASLLELAMRSPNALRKALDPNGEDFFSLQTLEQISNHDTNNSEQPSCPFTEGPAWLPKQLGGTEATVHHWKHRVVPVRQKGKVIVPSPPPEGTTNVPVMVWYDHLSKAGGTSFCEMATNHMGKVEVPGYYCMPSDEKSPDARVGQWPNDRLINYYHTSHKHLVSNEWEPFPLDKLKLQATSPHDLSLSSSSKTMDHELWLLFVTSLREPLDRLASAHKFWGVLHNNETPHPTFSKWILKKLKNAKRDFADATNGLGKPGSKGNDFLAMVGRSNFATWKFSGGAMPLLPKEPNQPFPLQEMSWNQPFETAIRTLSRFDLVIPMELLKQHPQPLNDLLGWEHDEQAQHIVSAGQVINSNARTALPDDTEYNTLWDANRLDMILYHWTKAVYLTRIHCSSQPFLK
eukprot:scaffold114072_cov51-Attheya_sp.AAC.1